MESAIGKSRDKIDLINIDGNIIYSNRNEAEDFNISGWVECWPQAFQQHAAIALDEAREGRTHRFESYKPMENMETWWDIAVNPVYDKNGNVEAILSVARENTKAHIQKTADRILVESAERNVEQSQVIAREMRHRLKNVLAVVDSMARMTARRSTNIEDFLQAYGEQIHNLGLAQDILTADSGRFDLNETLNTILGKSGRSHQISINDIPDVVIPQSDVTIIALLVGELQTNSLKYGALATDQGKVSLTCEIANKTIIFIWREDSCEPVTPGIEGNGHTLMRQMTRGSGFPFTVDWTGTGLIARFGITQHL